MHFSLTNSLEILDRTPRVLSALLKDLNDDWINAKEEEGSWTLREVLAHLIVCERTNWIPRAHIILSNHENRIFEAMDMQAHFEIASNNSMDALLDVFGQLRKNGISVLREFHLSDKDLLKTGIHPVNGEVTLKEILATWVTHDLSHIAQLVRIIAKQQKDEVGSFRQYLRILH